MVTSICSRYIKHSWNVNNKPGDTMESEAEITKLDLYKVQMFSNGIRDNEIQQALRLARLLVML